MVKEKTIACLRAKHLMELEDKRQRRRFQLWNIVLFLLSSLGLCLVSLFLSYGTYPDGVFLGYLKHPFVILLNFLPILLFQLLLYGIFNRQWAAFMGTALLFIGASLGNYYKLKFRYDPFMFSDIGSIKTALGVSSQYDLTPDLRILFCVLCVIAGTLFLFFLVRGRARPPLRVSCIALVLLALYPLWHFVYASKDIYENKAVANDYINPSIATQLYISKGFVYPFLHSITDSANVPPEGYSEEKAGELLSPYTDASIPADRKVNLLAIQLEAFNDLSRLGIDGISDKVYAPFFRLAEESFSGRLVVNVFGGGTVNTERAFLTGSVKLLEPRTAIPSYVWYLRSQGYSVIGNHPYYQDYYNRINANISLGFESYRFYENYYSAWPDALQGLWFDDGIFMQEVLAEYRQYAAEGKPVFSFNVSLQGHGPYDTEKLLYDEEYWAGTGFSDCAYCAMNNYLGSVTETCKAVWALVEELRADETPVILVLYGDHNPWMGDNGSVYSELGVDFDLSTEEGFLNYYSTPYLVWANDAAKAQLNADFSGTGPTVSANYLMELVFSLAGWDGSTYMQLSADVRESLPVITTNGYYVENGCFTASLSPEGAEKLRGLEYAVFYLKTRFEPPA